MRLVLRQAITRISPTAWQRLLASGSLPRARRQRRAKNAANAITGAYGTNAANQANAAMAAGNATASSYANMGSAINGTVNNLASLYLYQNGGGFSPVKTAGVG
jgi:hypothetical protein